MLNFLTSINLFNVPLVVLTLFICILHHVNNDNLIEFEQILLALRDRPGSLFNLMFPKMLMALK